MSVTAPAPNSADVLADLHRARRRQRTGQIHWVDALYQVYVTALAVIAAILFLSSAIGDERLSPESVRQLADLGPAWLGLLAAAAVSIGLRSGCRGGPLAVEAADVRHVLLSPVDRRAALRSPALRQLRFACFVAGAVGAAVGQFAARRLVGHGTAPAWVIAGAVFGVVVVCLALGSALVASGRRLPSWIATAVAAVLLGAGVAEVAGVLPWSPLATFGDLALWPLNSDPSALVALAITAAVVALGLSGVSGVALEAAERRTALVGQMRFAVTMQDLRTVMVLRRQLAADLPRTSPWIRLRRRSRFPVWQRGWRGLLRFPAARLARMLVLAIIAGVALHGVWNGTTPLLLVAALSLWIAALDAIEPLSQETDHPTRLESLPHERGSVLVRHLPVSLLGMLVIAGVAAAVGAIAASTGDERAVLLIAVLPMAVGTTAGAVISVLMGAPKPMGQLAMATPEIAGVKTAMRTIWPPAVALIGTLPVWMGARAADAGDDAVAAAVLTAVAACAVGVNVAVWVRMREAAHAWWEQASEAALSGKTPGSETGDEDEDDQRSAKPAARNQKDRAR